MLISMCTLCNAQLCQRCPSSQAHAPNEVIHLHSTIYLYLRGPAPLANLQCLFADQISLWCRAVLVNMPCSTGHEWISSLHCIPPDGSALELGLGQYTSSHSISTDFHGVLFQHFKSLLFWLLFSCWTSSSRFCTRIPAGISHYNLPD